MMSAMGSSTGIGTGHQNLVRKAQNELSILSNRITDLNEEIRKLHYCSNMKTLINAVLPHDVLSYIFSALMDLSIAEPYTDRGTYLASLYISHVCTYWREIIPSQPYLWNKRIPYKPDGLKAFLERSRLLPIPLGYSAAETLISLSKNEPALLSNSGRAAVRYLRVISGPRMLQTVVTTFNTTAPRLEFLILIHDNMRDSSLRPDVLVPASVDMSHLRILDVRSCCGLQWDHVKLRNLTRFCMTGPRFDTEKISVVKITAILACSSRLEHLQIRDAILDDRPVTRYRRSCRFRS